MKEVWIKEIMVSNSINDGKAESDNVKYVNLNK